MWGKPFPVAWVADGETEAGLVSGMTLTHCTERVCQAAVEFAPE